MVRHLYEKSNAEILHGKKFRTKETTPDRNAKLFEGAI